MTVQQVREYLRKFLKNNIQIIVEVMSTENESVSKTNKHQQEQINQLQKLLENQQVLTLQANKK